MRPFLLALALTCAAAAQPAPALSIEGLLPLSPVEIQGSDLESRRTTGLSTAFALGGRVPVGQGLTVEAQVPLATVSVETRGLTVDGSAERASEVALGNPYVGVDWVVRRGPSTVSVVGGVRLPLAPSESGEDASPYVPSASGSLWEMTVPEQREAFLPRLVSVRLGVRARQVVASGVALAVEAGPVLGVGTEVVTVSTTPQQPGEELRPTYAAMVYRLAVEGRAGPVALAGGLIGAERIQSLDDYRYSPVTMAVAEVGLAGPIRPKLHARVPLRDFSGETSVGVGVAVDL